MLLISSSCSISSNSSICNTDLGKQTADWESAFADGEAKLMKFLEEHLLTKIKSLFDFVPKDKRLTFANEKRKKLSHQVKIK